MFICSLILTRITMYFSDLIRCNDDVDDVGVGYLRLGCMARDKGQIYEASDWFKEALQINQVL